MSSASQQVKTGAQDVRPPTPVRRSCIIATVLMHPLQAKHHTQGALDSVRAEGAFAHPFHRADPAVARG